VYCNTEDCNSNGSISLCYNPKLEESTAVLRGDKEKYVKVLFVSHSSTRHAVNLNLRHHTDTKPKHLQPEYIQFLFLVLAPHLAG
jgi:hypothetical protein